MKTVNDFEIINGVAVLRGVSYAEEAKVVDEYLRNNKGINYVTVVTKDGRNFTLREGKLVKSCDETFINPYYENLHTYKKKEGTSFIEPLVIDRQPKVVINRLTETEKESMTLENRVLSLEKQLFKNKQLLQEMVELIKTSIE